MFPADKFECFADPSFFSSFRDRPSEAVSIENGEQWSDRTNGYVFGVSRKRMHGLGRGGVGAVQCASATDIGRPQEYHPTLRGMGGSN